VEAVPPSAPQSWHSLFSTGQFFAFEAGTWRLRSPDSLSEELLGIAHAESLITLTESAADGLTRLIAIPSRTGSLTLLPPSGGRLLSARINDGPVATADEGGGMNDVAVLSSGEPVAILLRWSVPLDDGLLGKFRPALPALARFDVRHATVAVASSGPWQLSMSSSGAQPRLRELRRRRAQFLIQAASVIPSGTQFPDWLASELRFSTAHFDRDRANALSPDLVRKVNALLAQRGSKETASVLTGPAEISTFITAGEMIDAAVADHRSAILTEGNALPWRIHGPASRFLVAAMWLIASALLLRRLLKWATRWRLADQLAEHAATTLLVAGIIWWLCLSPSVFGLALVAFVVVYRTLPSRIRPRFSPFTSSA
jgi:hypothetical protein